MSLIGIRREPLESTGEGQEVSRPRSYQDDACLPPSPSLLWNHQHSRWFDLVWLIYSVFFFIEPVQRNTAHVWVLFACVYAIFLALYVGIIRASSPRMAYGCLAAMAVLGLSYYPFNQSAGGMLVYVVAFTPFIVESVAVCIIIFAVIAIAGAAEGFLLHLSPWSWGFMSLFSFAIGGGNLFMALRMRANQKLNLAQEQIAHLAKLAERERIARDLHDVLGHTLSVVVLKSELAGKLMQQSPERAKKEIGEVEQIARTALADVREAIRGYRSEGLAAEIERARTALDAAGVSLDCTTTPLKLRPGEETVVSLIVREAVTNIVRHAQASHCSIIFKEDERMKWLVVEDNGRGGIRHEGNGLRGMRERVESLGGKLRFDSEAGTRLTIEIPA